MSREALHGFITDKLPWIQRHQARFAAEPPALPHRYETGEVHYFGGRAYTLRVRETATRPHAALEDEHLCLYVPGGAVQEVRARLVEAFYRKALREAIPPLIARWEPVMDVKVGAWGVRRMKTRWGSCNPRARRIWLSLALAQKPAACLEYVVVHEMVHLLEASHNARFYALMTHYLPGWERLREELNLLPRADNSQ